MIRALLSYYFLSIFGLSCLLLTACSDENPNAIAQAINTIQQQRAAPLAALSLPALKPRRAYQLSQEPSPFAKLSQQSPPLLSPLQSYAVDSLRLVGTLKQNNQQWALILLPDNQIYKGQTGDIISNQRWQIKTISTQRLSLFNPQTTQTIYLNLTTKTQNGP